MQSLLVLSDPALDLVFVLRLRLVHFLDGQHVSLLADVDVFEVYNSDNMAVRVLDLVTSEEGLLLLLLLN